MVIVFEEGIKKGGVGSAILEFAAEREYQVPIILEGIGDQFVPHGNIADLMSEVGLDKKSIKNKLQLLLNKIQG